MPKSMTRREIDAELRRRREQGQRSAFRVAPCLYLHPKSPTAAQWLARVSVGGRVRPVYIGPYELVTLDEAKEIALEHRRAARRGIDPIEEKRRVAFAPETFGDFAVPLIDDVTSTMKNAKHRAQWRSTVEKHCGPIWGTPISALATDDVLRVLKPIWTETPETASRLRGRLERILDAATARGLRDVENPARWRGDLDSLLPRPKKLARGHHAAMPWRDVPAFYARLVEAESVSSQMLRFLILTAARSGEVRGASWRETDRQQRLWIVPAERMKAGKPHRVPLTSEAEKILDQVDGLHSELIFPSPSGVIYSDMVFAKLLKRMGVENATAHGFRSSFRDWTNEAAQADWHVAEMCLAHSVGGAVERAYARSDLFALRRELLSNWARFVAGEAPLDPKPGRSEQTDPAI